MTKSEERANGESTKALQKRYTVMDEFEQQCGTWCLRKATKNTDSVMHQSFPVKTQNIKGEIECTIFKIAWKYMNGPYKALWVARFSNPRGFLPIY